MIRTALISLLLAAASLLLSSCQRDSGPEPLVLTGKMFVFNYRLAYATYMVTLARAQPIDDGSTIVATFENPAGGAPLTLLRPGLSRLDKVVLESPYLQCVKKDRAYAITIELKAADGAVLQRIETTLKSSADQDILPERPLVVGPGYDMNPDVFADGKPKDGRIATATCPVDI